MNFEWIDYYTEFATKLLTFKDNREELIHKIYSIYDNIGISVPKLEKDDEITDIDPFTVFGLFNKGITNNNRILILNGIASEFQISANIPVNFDGVPVLNNLKATFYSFIDERNDSDIDNIWELFEAAINFSESNSKENRQRFIEYYNIVHEQRCIKWNITIGLYWIRPYTFINLDSRNRWYMVDTNNMPDEFINAINKKLNKVPYADKIDVRDTTGAGDSFIGAFLYCLLNDEVEDLESVSDDTLRNYLDFANAYAANTTTKEGALAAMADRAEMDEWMKTLKK